MRTKQILLALAALLIGSAPLNAPPFSNTSPLHAQPPASQQKNDKVIFTADKDPNLVTWGRLTGQTAGQIKYESPGTNRSIILNPWEIKYVEYGYKGLDEWSEKALFALRSGNYKDAALGFEKFINSDLQTIPAVAADRAHLAYATYYYLGMAYLGLGREADGFGESSMRDIQDVFPVSVSKVFSDKRDADFRQNPGKLSDAKEAVRRAADRVLSALLRAADKETAAKLNDAVNAADSASALAEVVRTEFRNFYKQFSSPSYQKAAEVLTKLFVDVKRDTDYTKIQSFWVYEMKYATAESYLGLQDYAKAISELDDAAEPIRPQGQAPIPPIKRPNKEANPTLLFLARQGSASNSGYFNYVFRGRVLMAKIYETANDMRNARLVYKDLAENTKDPAFVRFRNDAQLAYGVFLSKGEGGDYNTANKYLSSLLGKFQATNDGSFESGYVLDPADAIQYAGAFVGLGEIAYVEYQKTKTAKFRQLALENFLKVTAMFSVDPDKRAQALYWASKIMREIAEEEWATKYSGKGKEWDVEVPGSSEKRKVFNPYVYYMETADELRNELRKNYADSKWAKME